MSSFVTLKNLVAEVLLGIGDETNRRYEVKATQWILNTIRRLHINFAPYYREERLLFDNEDIFTIDYPKDMVKPLAVGIYMNEAFWSFTKRQDLSILATGAETTFDGEAGEGGSVPSRGAGFGAQGSNLGYWIDDQQNCRIMVRLMGRHNVTGTPIDFSSRLKDKGVIVRYKSTGLDKHGDICVPVEAKDLIVAKVIYDFMRRGWGIPLYNYNIQLQREEVDALQAEYETLMYEPTNFWEVKDSLFSSLNTTARR